MTSQQTTAEDSEDEGLFCDKDRAKELIHIPNREEWIKTQLWVLAHQIREGRHRRQHCIAEGIQADMCAQVNESEVDEYL